MQTIEFTLNTEHIALCDLLKLTGLANSGGQAKTMIAELEARIAYEMQLKAANLACQ